MLELLALLLPIAAGSGWYFGRRSSSAAPPPRRHSIPREYYMGLNFLINEQPDKALDIFIKMLEVDAHTVEMHLALGTLFRRRGEVDRAIRIHQNLIARPGLNKQERSQSLLELAQDYLSAGVFDRAERLFHEAIAMGGKTAQSLKLLLTIYEQEKDWENAIEVAKKLEGHQGGTMRKQIAHYYCELAELSRAQHALEQTKRYLKKALATNPDCVRAGLIRAALELDAGQYKTALRYYKRIKAQDPEYLSEVVIPMAFCCEQLGKEQELIDYLQECLKTHPRVSIMLILSEKLRGWKGEAAAIQFMREQLRQYPTLRGLNRVIELHIEDSDGAVKDNLSTLKEITDKLLTKKDIYQCIRCGFSGKVMHWLCPGCRNWSTVKPIRGLEGD